MKRRALSIGREALAAEIASLSKLVSMNSASAGKPCSAKRRRAISAGRS